ncbi:MAG: LysM peptidoglycan-binding domain-containing protein [Sandaracinaceae bacterium]|nr:LysM peptidoglycan-binding domain-containing protein [Sandaracinaceae bacterium]
MRTLGLVGSLRASGGAPWARGAAWLSRGAVAWLPRLARAAGCALVVGALASVASESAAQFGVYEDEAQSLEEARRNRDGIRIQGNVRRRMIPHVYTVRRGDTLWDVTGRFYGNPWEWPRVWSYNPEVTNPHWIYPHDQLRLLAPGEVVETAQPAQPGVRGPARTFQAGTVHLRQMGFLDRDALDQAGVVVGSPEDHMLLAPFDTVYLEFGEDYRGTPAGEHTIYREIDREQREEDGEGELVRIFGAVRIESYDRDRRTARATIIDALDPIERGYRVAPVPRRFDLVPPRVADRDRETHVAATLLPLQLQGDQQIVFIPIGSEDGVQPGHRFFLTAAGDRWRAGLSAPAREHGALVDPPDEPEAYPAEVIAEGRVVHVRPSSATLMITRSVREVERGDRAEMRAGY